MKVTYIIIRVKLIENIELSQDIDDFPCMAGKKNSFDIISQISSKLGDKESKEFCADPGIIKLIIQSVSSLQLNICESDIIVYCFNDVPGYITQI